MPDHSLSQTLAADSTLSGVRSVPLFKLLRLAAEITRGGLILWLQFPRLGRDGRLVEIQRWAQNILQILEIEVQCDGVRGAPHAALVVANHLSWLDVLVVQSLMPGVFVAKSEVRHWPLIGSMAAACATIFVDRSSRQSARTMVDGTLAAFAQGYSVVAFPEGTSSDGSDLAAFHANIFEGAIKAQTQIQPLTLRYVHAHSGLPSKEALFIDDMTLASSLRSVLKSSSIRSHVHVGGAISSLGHNRKSLAHQAHQSIREQLTRQSQSLA